MRNEPNGMTEPQDIRHPAKFSDPIIVQLESILPKLANEQGRPLRVLDPFAGVGGIHRLAIPGVVETVGVEIEEGFARVGCQPTLFGPTRMIVANAKLMPFRAGTFDAICTSPAYGNRFADDFKIGKHSRWKYVSYSFGLGRSLHPDNGGKYYYGKKYKELHVTVWRECVRVLREQGWLVLNISDFVKQHAIVEVSQWHHDVLLDLGFDLIDHYEVATKRLHYGSTSSSQRATHENIYIFKRKARS